MKNELYGQVDFTTKTPKIIKNPGILPSVFKYSNGKQISGFKNSKKCYMKINGFCKLVKKQIEIPVYDEKTEKITEVYEYKNGMIEVSYKIEKITTDSKDISSKVS